MNSFNFFTQVRICLVSLCFSLMLSTAPLAAQYEEEITTQDYLYIKGMVNSVSLQNQTVSIQQNRGPRIVIFVSQETELKGFGKIEELKSRQEVKVWYRPSQAGNIGLKIFRLPELGC